MSFDETAGIPVPEAAETRRESLVDRIRSLRALDLEVALRSAVAAGVPLLVLVLVDRVEWAPCAAFGAMAAI
ncbi:hypothetical protein [Agromyces bauzanensis]